MKNKRWFFEFEVEFVDKNVVSSVSILVFAEGKFDAERQARIAAEMFKSAAEANDLDFLEDYFGLYGHDISFRNFYIVCKGEGEREESKKELDIQIPRVVLNF